ncbi:MAG: hypothetical protein C4523_04090 [Myxococcales bacterium]|nr:MAG: hypothetical protein C4523_04090 [Myxococcales bacterium]
MTTGRIYGLVLGLLLIVYGSGCAGGEEETSFPDGDEPATDGDDIGADGDADGDLAADGDIADGDEEPADDEPASTGLALQPLDGLAPRMEFDDTADFFAAPFPHDARLKDGKVDLSALPNPKRSSLVKSFIQTANTELDGFGTNSPAYWTFEAPIGPASLPASPADSLNTASAVFLVNIDPDSAEYGDLTPIEWEWTPDVTTYEPGNQLAVAPYDGFPLRPRTTYAMILTDALHDTGGQSLGRPLAMCDWLNTAGDDAVRRAYAPLIDWLLDDSSGFDPEHLRAATVFTTLDPVGELKTIRDYLAAEYPNGEVQGELLDCLYTRKQDGYLVFEGHYTSPNLQEGDVPYATQGGDIQFGLDGKPIVQRMEELRFSLSVPADATIPAGGWPIVMQAHGTGGSYRSYLGTGQNDESTRMLAVKLAVIGIDQPLHGPRGDNGSGELSTNEVEIYSFNFANPIAARSNFRQSAVDTIALTHFIRAGELALDRSVCSSWPSMAEYGGPDRIAFSRDIVLFHGHSHGGLSGALAAAVEDDVKAWMLSGAGGRMAITVMEREDPSLLDLLQPLVGVPAGEAHKHHPLIGLVQLLVEITDPINYAPYWIDSPHDGRARNIFATTGFTDAYTPKKTAAAMAVAGRLPLIEPVAESIVGLELRGVDSLARPASNTVSGPDSQPATAGFSQYPDDGHFAIYYNDDAASMYQEFLRSVAYDGTGVLGY